MRPIFLTVALMLCAYAVLAQSPPGINYQGVARNQDGKPLSQKDITIRINIAQGVEGDVEYAEVHSVTTNSFGLFSLVIGTGSVETGDFGSIGWALGNKWLRVEMDPDGGSAFKLMGSQQFMSVPYAFYAKSAGNTQQLTAGQGISITDNKIVNAGDADNNATNEYNTDFALSTDRKLRITDGGGTKEVDLTGIAAGGVLQDLNLTGNKLKVTDNPTATEIDLGPYLDNTDAQDLTLTGNSLGLSNDATPVDLTSFMDNTDAQTLTLTGNQLAIAGGNNVDLTVFKDNTDNQDLTLSGNTLNLTNDATPIDLTAFKDNTDNQDLTLTGNTLNLTNDVTPIDLTPFKDNTDNQDLTLTGNTLSLTGDATPINLTPYLDNTDSQSLGATVSGTLRTVTISGGTGVTIDVSDNDNSATNEIQNLSLAGNTLSLSSDATPVDLSTYLDNTDQQTLTITGNNLAISGGNSVDLATFAGDSQTLALAGSTLSITGGNNVSLTPFLDNTDNQDLTLSGNTLSLSNDATAVNLAPYLDNTDNQDLALSGNVLSLTNDATAVSLAPYLDNTDNQDLTLTGNTLSLTNDATPINLTPYLDNTDNQNLGVTTAGTNRMLSIVGGTGVTINVADDDSDALNEIQSLTYTSGTKQLQISGGTFGVGTTVTIPETQNINDVLTQSNDAQTKKITNLGAPTANGDAATKQYVDTGDAALNARISANYAFKTGYTFSTLLAVSAITLPLSGELFDDFSVVDAAAFTAPTAGTYLFVLDGTTTGLLASAAITLSYAGNNYPVTVGNGGHYNSTFMFRLTVGQTVTVVATGLGINTSITGTFYGYKLL